MKLTRLPANLPIESLDSITNLLGLFVTGVQDQYSLVKTAHDYDDYNETLKCLRDDFDVYHELYQTWQGQANTHEQRYTLTAMHEYLRQATILLTELERVKKH